MEVRAVLASLNSRVSGHVVQAQIASGHGSACGSWGPDGETSSRVGTWQDKGTPFRCQLGRRGIPS